MKTIALLLLCSVAQAGEYGALYEKVPADDMDNWYVTLVKTEGCKSCEKLEKDLKTSEHLRQFTDSKRSHFTSYTIQQEQGKRYTRFLKVKQFPLLIVQPPRGGEYGRATTIVFQQTGYDGNSFELRRRLREAIRRYIDTLRTPIPPEPAPMPRPRPPPVILPLVGPPVILPPEILPPPVDQPVRETPILDKLIDMPWGALAGGGIMGLLVSFGAPMLLRRVRSRVRENDLPPKLQKALDIVEAVDADANLRRKIADSAIERLGDFLKKRKK